MASISKRASGAWQNTSYGIRGTATDTITILPTTIYSDGTNATVSIKGNTTQSGTSTPATPIQPQECGDLSENLYDVSNPNIFNGYYNVTTNTLLTTENNAFIYIPLVQGKKYYVYGCKRYNTSTLIRWVTTSSAPFYNISCVRTDQFAQTDIFTITAEANENYLAIFLCGDSDYSAYGTVKDAIATNGVNLVIDNGYKIPISSANTTTPVYLGEVETTRKIKKLVLDGTETITEESTNVYSIPITDTVTTGTGLSTHFEYDSTVSVGQFRIEAGKVVFGYNDTLANFSTFLVTQYAAGTPVTVWYVLANEETAVVNEPLMRIGDYADEVSGVSIPTTDGANTLSVDTTVQPSEVSVNYHGWHMGTVHERAVGQWD